ncbi:MAG: hypothetical protein M9950_02925 [Thermomicrobiales bacterium]|nr:hypothetical protein [Thermomicrobiales bacterium]
MSKIGNILTSTLNRVPGYKGYRDKEDRRDEDKRVREAVADAIVSSIDRLTAYNATLAAARSFDALTKLEAEVGQIRLLADRIRHATYGYGGIFTEDSVDANALEQLRLFDAALLREADGLAAAVDSVTSTTPPGDEAMAALTGERNRLTTLFNGRSSVVDQATPSKDEAVIDLLAIPEVIEPSPLLQAKKGDALSVLGDNFIANGVVKLSAATGETILLRVTTESEGATWLLGSSDPNIDSARLTEGVAVDGTTTGITPASASVDTAQGKQTDIAARYSYEDLGDNQVVFTLALGDSIVSYSGSTIVDGDIEVYSAE